MTGQAHRISAKRQPESGKRNEHGSADREYVIYNYAFPTSERKGADWYRYGAIKNRVEAEQLAADLYDSAEFACVEVHEMHEDRKTGARQSRLVRRFSNSWKDSAAARMSALWFKVTGVAALVTGVAFLGGSLF